MRKGINTRAFMKVPKCEACGAMKVDGQCPVLLDAQRRLAMYRGSQDPVQEAACQDDQFTVQEHEESE